MQAFSSNLVEILLGVKATFFHHFPSTSPCFPQARNQPPHVILFLDLGDFAHSNAGAVRRALHGHGATVLAVPGALPPPQEPADGVAGDQGGGGSHEGGDAGGAECWPTFFWGGPGGPCKNHRGFWNVFNTLQLSTI